MPTYISTRWCGWIRDLQVKPPWVWQRVEQSLRSSEDACHKALNTFYPDPDSELGQCRYSKKVFPIPETPKGELKR